MGIDFLLQILSIALPILGKILIIIVPVIVGIAYLTLMERKVIAAMQLRVGPSVVGPFGLLQPIADAIKVLFKEVILPRDANKALFLLAPVLTFGLAMSSWAVIPFAENFVVSDINIGVMYLLVISSLGVYGIILSGWASNSKYAFLGAVRSSAQMISYEVSIGLILMNVVILTGSLNLKDIVLAQKTMWYAIPLFPVFIMFFISGLAETNRLPFDLPEAESELVAGYNVEYGSMQFAMFFLGEYGNMILISSFTTILFLGGWLPPFGLNDGVFAYIPGVAWFVLKVLFILFCFIWVRASLPRYRYDQLMRLGWKIFLPLSLMSVLITSSYVVFIK